MKLLLEMLLLLGVSALAIPVAVVCIQCLAAVLPGRTPHNTTPGRRPRIAVLVPAHNEQAVLAETLEAIKAQLNTGDRLVVVADNCTDDTAHLARETGAEVVERNDAGRRGKGYALDCGIRYLEHDPPETVVVLDADCEPESGAIVRIAHQAAAIGRPVQACYTMESSGRPNTKETVSRLAFIVKNLVRPLGLKRLGMPCLLTGTGMAFPWPIIATASLADGNIVEDMNLGINLAIDGHPAILCSEARVTSRMPERPEAAAGQRKRWEHGHLHTLLNQVPRLTNHSVLKRKPSLAVMALDLSVPPLALLSLLLGLAFGGCMLAAFAGLSHYPALICAASIASLAACIAAAWFKFARRTIPVNSLLMIPLYVAWKIPIYLSFAIRRQETWVRTERKAEEAQS